MNLHFSLSLSHFAKPSVPNLIQTGLITMLVISLISVTGFCKEHSDSAAVKFGVG